MKYLNYYAISLLTQHLLNGSDCFITIPTYLTK